MDDIQIYLRPFTSMRMLAVPIFMMISFVLVEKDIIERNPEKIKKRFKRLLIPHVGWAFIYYFIYSVTDILGKTNWVSGLIDLIKQIFTGAACLCPQLWYQTVLIFLTVLFVLVFYLFSKKKAVFTLYTLTLGAIYLQYSGNNFKAFSNLPSETMYITGRTAEMLPLAVIGFLMAYCNFQEKVKKRHREIIIGSVMMFILLYTVDLFGNMPAGFAYQGLFYIAVAFIVVVIAMALPFEVFSENKKSIILWISKYSPGIYYIHWGVGRYMNLWLENRKMITNTLGECFVILIVSFMISVMIAGLPGRLGKQLVK